MNERKLLIWLHENRAPVGLIEKILDKYGTISKYLASDDFRPETKEGTYFRSMPAESTLERMMEELHDLGISVHIRGEADYPQPLDTIPDAPLFLYKKGTLEPADLLSIGVVGSRKCTPYGAWACEKLVRELAAFDVTVVSGLALGIDRIAHETALKTGTRTIGVLGNGLRSVYPASHKTLHREVINHGCVISEFPTTALPLPHHFPYRNRIIAGLTLGLLVVEAKEKSGTMSTAAHALAQGKDVFVVPGNIDSLYSIGCNRLIQDGATLTLSADDILEQIARLSVLRKRTQTETVHALTEEEQQILDLLKDGPLSADALVQKTGTAITDMYALLTLLEMKDAVSARNGLYFTNT